MSYADAWCRLKKEPRFASYFKKQGDNAPSSSGQAKHLNRKKIFRFGEHLSSELNHRNQKQTDTNHEVHIQKNQRRP